MNMSRTNPGFSLIELMTVLLITGLLLTLAWPSYQSHVRRGHRVEAATALMEAQHFMERHYAVQGRYTTATGTAPALPLRLQTVPAQGTVRYRLKLESGGGQLHAARRPARWLGRRCLWQPHPGEHRGQGPHRQWLDRAAVLAMNALPQRLTSSTRFLKSSRSSKLR